MNPETGGSSCFAKGTAARKTAADATTTKNASRRSPGPGDSVERNTGRESTDARDGADTSMDRSLSDSSAGGGRRDVPSLLITASADQNPRVYGDGPRRRPLLRAGTPTPRA